MGKYTYKILSIKNIIYNDGFFYTNNSQIASFDQVYIITKKCNILSIFIQ